MIRKFLMLKCWEYMKHNALSDLVLYCGRSSLFAARNVLISSPDSKAIEQAEVNHKGRNADHFRLTRSQWLLKGRLLFSWVTDAEIWYRRVSKSVMLDMGVLSPPVLNSLRLLSFCSGDVGAQCKNKCHICPYMVFLLELCLARPWSAWFLKLFPFSAPICPYTELCGTDSLTHSRTHTFPALWGL